MEIMKGSSARRRKGAPSGLRELIRNVEKDLGARIDHLRDELRASETALEAARLRELNERQAREGVARLRHDLTRQHQAGIIDANGRRLQQTLPERMSDPSSDVV